YNLVRAVSSFSFAVFMVVLAVSQAQPAILIAAALGLVVAVDALYRYFNPRSGPLGGILVDATVIAVALTVHGPDPGLNGLAVMAMLVTSALLVPPLTAIGVVGYFGLLSVGMVALEAMDAPFVAILGEESEHVVMDAMVVAAFILTIAWVLFLTVREILKAQDRQAEALARERRALELKNEFVSMVSHELRTPLTGIAGFTETLTERWADLPPDEVDEFLDIMGHETDHLTNLVEDILVIPRLEAGQLRLEVENFDLATEAHAMANLTFRDDSFAVAIPPGVTVSADRTRVRQILRNLMDNAHKYGGDQVLIDGELTRSGLYAVSIADNGRGVPPEAQDRIFEHFEQLSTGDDRLQQGVGLGLPIALKLASAMGGDLWYQDRFPSGADFRFTLPLADRAPEHSEASNSEPTEEPSGEFSKEPSKEIGSARAS
ncbi:MAG: sensor histidine kinase, partial [Acidimicrobiia bacterium]